MVINEQRKHLHFEMPKTASGSIHVNCGTMNYHTFPMHTGIEFLKKNNPIIYKKLIAPSINNWLVSCIIRNPWEHAISYYYHALDEKRFFKENFFYFKNFKKLSREELLKKDVSLKRFLLKSYIPYRAQNKKLKIFDPQEDLINYYINYNNYNKMKDFLKTFGIDGTHKKIHTRTEIKTIVDLSHKKDYREHYEEETYNMIKENCQKEIDIFDYDF